MALDKILFSVERYSTKNLLPSAAIVNIFVGGEIRKILI